MGFTQSRELNIEFSDEDLSCSESWYVTTGKKYSPSGKKYIHSHNLPSTTSSPSIQSSQSEGTIIQTHSSHKALKAITNTYISDVLPLQKNTIQNHQEEEIK